MSHDDQGQAGAERRFPLWFKGGKPQAQSPEESAKGFHSGATRPRPPGRRSSPSPPQRHDQRLFAGEDHFSQDRMYYLSPSKSRRCEIPSRSYLGSGPRPLYIGLSHHHSGREMYCNPSTTPSQEYLTSRGLFILCTSSSIAPRGNPPHHTGLGY